MELKKILQQVDPMIQQSQFGQDMKNIFKRVNCEYFRIAPHISVELHLQQLSVLGAQIQTFHVACRHPKYGPRESCDIYLGRECKYPSQKADNATDLR